MLRHYIKTTTNLNSHLYVMYVDVMIECPSIFHSVKGSIEVRHQSIATMHGIKRPFKLLFKCLFTILLFTKCF